MLSKNNYPERLRKMEQKNEHYSIRKFSAGAASVLIGITFMGMGNSQTVKADTNQNTEPTTDSDPSHVAKSNTTSAKDLKGVEVVASSDNNKEETSQSSTQSVDTKADDQTQTATDAAKSDDSNKTSDKKTEEKNKEEKQTSKETATLDTSKENIGLAGRTDLSESKAESDAAALTGDAKQADKEAEETANAVADNALNKTATETITYTAPDGYSFVDSNNQKSQTATETVTVNASRSGTNDRVTGNTTYTDWVYDPADKNYAETLVTKFNGYTPQASDENDQVIDLTEKDGNYYIPSTAAFTEDGEPIDKKINIKYTADQAQANIKYIDVNNKDGQPVDTQVITGKTGENVSLSLTDSNNATKLDVPSGWEIAQNTSYPTSVTLKADDSDDVTIYVQHKTTTTYGGDSKDSDVYKVVEQNITINKPDGSTQNIDNHITFARNKTVDEAANTTSYSDWKNITVDSTTNQAITGFVAQNVAIQGYTATATDNGSAITLEDGKIPAVDNVTADTPSQNITVSYTPIQQVLTINYVNKSDSKTVHTQTVTGDPGQSVTYTLELPDGYQYAADENGKTPTGTGTITFGTEGTTSETVYVEPKVEDGRADKDNTDLYRAVTETANITQPGQTSSSPATATYYFYRTKDSAGNYTAWESNTEGVTGTDFGELEVPTHAGYTVVIKNGDTSLTPVVKDGKTYIPAISSLGTDGNPEDKTLTVTYEAQDAEYDINYVSTEGKTIYTQTLSGKTGDVIHLSTDGADSTTKLAVPNGWQMVPGSTYPSTVTLTANTGSSTVQIEHAQTQLDPNTDTSDDLVRTITRKVTYAYPDGTTSDGGGQAVTYYRTGTKDALTGEITYGTWQLADGSSSKWDARDVTLQGYTATASDGVQLTNTDGKYELPEVAVTPDTKSQDITITYAAADQTYTINYVDGTATVGTQEVTGKTGETKTFTYEVPTGYELVKNADGTTVTGSTVTLGSSSTSVNVPVQKATNSSTTTPTTDPTQGNTGTDTDKKQTVSQVINFVDITDGSKVVEARTMTGEEGSSVTLVDSNNHLTLTVPNNYKYVAQTLPASFTYHENADPIEIKVEHATTTLNSTTNPDDPNYVKTITEKITYTYPNEASKVLSNDVKYYRTGTKDLVTGNVTYGDWTAATNTDGTKQTSFVSQTFPAIDGYTAVYTDAKGQTHTLTPNSDGKVVIPEVQAPADGPSEYNLSLVYNNDKTGKPDDPNAEHTLTINYVDNSDKTTIVGHQEYTGKAGDTVTIEAKAPDKWQFAADQTVPGGEYTFGSTDPEAQTVYVTHKLDVQYGSQNTDNPDLYRTVTRTIAVEGATQNGSQTKTFTRNLTTDEVTNKSTYSDWTSSDGDNYAEMELPAVTGQTPQATEDGQTLELITKDGKTYIPAESALVNGEPADKTVNVKYVADTSTTTPTSNKVNITVNYTYNGKTVGQNTNPITVTKGKSVNILPMVKSDVPDGYQVDSSVQLPAKEYNEDTTITVPVDKYDPTTDTDTDSIVTQGINYVADGTTVGTQNLTGKVGTSYEVVTSGTAGDGQVLIEAPEGYQLATDGISSPITLYKQAQPISIPVTPITYSGNVAADAQKHPELAKTVTGIYQYNIYGQVSDSGKMSVSFYRTGSMDPKTGEMTYSDWQSNMSDKSTTLPAVSVQSPKEGYSLKITTSTGQEITPTTNGNQETISGVSMLKDGEPTDVTVNVDYINDKTGTTDAATDPDAKTTKTTINLVDSSTEKVVASQEATGQSGTTGKVTVTVPSGYKLADGVTIPDTFTFADKDQTLTYNLVKDDSTTTPTTDPSQGDQGNTGDDSDTEVTQVINYVDQDTNKVVGSTSVSGKVGTMYQPILKGTPVGNEVLIEAPNNYSLAKQAINPFTLTKDAQAISIPVVANTTQETWDKHQDDTNYYRTITQTVTYNVPGQTSQKNEYKVIYYRNSTKNDATGEVTYTDWKAAGDKTIIAAHNVSLISGYTPVVTDDATGKQITLTQNADGDLEIPAMTTTPDTQSVSYTVNYEANTLSFKINYVDMDNNKTISTQVVSGKPNETVTIASQVPENWQLVPSSETPTGKNGVPDNYTFGTVAPSDVTVYIEPKVLQGNAEDNQNNPDLYKTVTGKVTVTMPGQEPEVKNSTTLHFYRDATYNPTTGKYDYSDWKANTSDGSTTFGGVLLSAVDGYTISAKDSNGQTITPELQADGEYKVSGANALVNGTPENVDVDVTYVKNGTTTPTTDPSDPSKGNQGTTTDEPTQDEVTRDIQYVADGTVVDTQTLKGKVGDTYETLTSGTAGDGQVLIKAPEGYTIAQSSIDKIITLTKDAAPVQIQVSPITEYGNSTDNQSNPEMYKTVTVNYTITGPNGDVARTSTTLAFYRNRTMDPATNAWKYTDWQSNMTDGSTTFAPLTQKVENGYTIKVTTSTGQEVTPTINGDNAVISGISGLKDGQPTDVDVTVDYVNNQTGTTTDPDATYTKLINYVTSDGSKVGEQKVTGKAGETVTINLQAPDGYQVVSGQNIPSSVKFGNQDAEPATVTVEKKTVTDPNQEYTYTINYDYNGKTVGSQEVKGKAGQTVSYTVTAPDNYQLVKDADGKVPGTISITFANKDDSTTIAVEPKVIQGNTTDNQNNDDVYKTVTVTYNLTLPGKATETKTTTLDFYRDATYDPETGSYNYTSWKSNMKDGSTTYASYTVPVLNGYTIKVSTDDKQNITPVTTADGKSAVVSGVSGLVGGEPTNVIVNIDYVNNQTGQVDNPSDTTRSFQINYVYNNQTVGNQTVSGKVGETTNYTYEVPDNYQLIPDSEGKVVTGGKVTFGNDQMDPLTVNVEPKMVTENGLETKNPDLYQVITRTVTYHMPSSTPEAQMFVSLAESSSDSNSQSQSITLYRTKTTNEATGETSYSKWQSNTVDSSGKPVTEFEAIDIPAAKGYKIEVTGANAVDTANGGKEIPAQSVLTADGNPISTPNINIDISYVADSSNTGNQGGTTTPDDQNNPTNPSDTDKEYTYTINYMDGQTNVSTQVLKGKTGTQQDVKLDVPNGYQIANGTTVPTKITIGTKDESINVPVVKTSSDNTGNQGGTTTPGDQTVTQVINYVADGTVVGTQSVTGKAGTMYTPIFEGTPKDDEVLIQAPDHYTLAKQSLKSFTLAKGADPISILVDAKITPENWNDHQDDSNYYRTITQNITWNIPGTQQQTTKYQVIYYRNGTLNEATGQVTYGDWKAAGDKTSFASHNVSLAAGYTPVVTDASGKQIELTKNDQGDLEIPEVVTTPASQDMDLFVNYTADEHKMVINYVNNNDKQVVSSQTITGKTNETVNYELEVPTNWEIVPGTSYPLGQVTFGTKDQDTQTVLIQPKTISGNTEGNQDNPDVYRTVKDTVVVNYPGKQPVVQNAQLSFYRTATMDPTTGEWTYSDWQSNMSDKSTSFPSITVSTIDGYTIVAQASDGRQITPLISGNKATISDISGLVNGQPQDVTITINYKNDSTGQEDNPVDPDATLYTYTINYMDGENKVGTQSVTGPQGAATQIIAQLPTGYKLADGASVPTIYTFQDKDETVNVAVVKNGSTTQTPDTTNDVTQVINYVANGKVVASQSLTGKAGTSYKVITSGSANDGEVLIQAPENYKLDQSSITSPIVLTKGAQPITIQVAPIVYDGREAANQSNPDLYKIVTGKYVYTLPGQTAQTTTTELAFYRTAQADPETGKLTYSDWKSNVVGDQTTFSSLSIPVINGYTIKATTSDGQTVTPEISGDNATISGVSGLSNGTPTDVTITIDYVNNNTGQSSDDNKPSDNNPSTPDNPNTPTDDQTTTVSGLDDKNNPDLYREITQTITITGPDGKTQSVDNHLIFYRDKTTNKETGQSTYTDWKSNSADNGQIVSDFSQLEVPTVKGYDVLVMKNDQQINLINKDGKVYLPAQAGLVDGTPEDQTITISYVAQSQSVKINFVDSSQKVISTQTVTGKTGEKVQLNLEVPKNWQLVPNTTVPTSVTIGADDNKDINVQIEHKLDVVDGRNDQSNPDLFKEVTRTIIMNWPGQKAGQSTASLAFYRIATTDEVTGETTYSDWTSASDTDEYPEQSVTMPGYTASADYVALITKDGKQYVPATEAEFNAQGTPVDSTIIVNYVGDKQDVQISYVEDGKTVSTQTVTGQTGQTVAIPLEIPTGYEIADGASYPSQITFGSNTQPISIAVSKIPAGQGRQTINYVDPDGQVVGNQYVTGTVGQSVDVTASLPINWKLADGASVPTSVTIKDTDTPIAVKVVSTTVQVDPSDPQTPGTEIDNAHGQTYPNGLTENDLNKTVTRTVNIVDPLTGKTATIVQTVKFTRTASVQVATGEVTYTDWTASGDKSFPAIIVPTVDGYTPSASVSEITPSYDYGNQTLTITYTKNSSSSEDTKSDSDKYKPDVSGETTITTNGDIKPEDVIKNASDLPEGTTFEWTDPTQVAEDLTKPGTYKDVGVKITYPDKSTTTVTTTLVVSDKQESSYVQEIVFEDAKTQEVIHSFKFTGPLTDGKATLSADKLKSVIESLFKVIQAGSDTYKDDTIVSLPTEDVVVTGDDNAPIIVMVGVAGEKTDSDNYTPEVNSQTTVTTNGKLEPQDVVTNADKMPEGTTFEWADPTQVAEDLTKPGTYKDVGVKITYPDKSTATVTTTIVVSDSSSDNTNTGSDTNNGSSSNTGTTTDNGNSSTVVPDNNSGSNTSSSTTNGSTTSDTNTDNSSSTTTDTDKTTSDQSSSDTNSSSSDSDSSTNSNDSDSDYDDSDYDDTDDEATPTRHHSHKSTSSSHGVASLAQARKHANNAQWLANHGYIVTVGPHGQVLSYRKSADGKGRIITAQVHGQSLTNTGASTSALAKAGLAGIKSNSSSNSTLPQTGEKDSEAAALGLGLISAAGLLGLAGAEKKRKKS